MLVDVISKYTNLSADEVERLLALQPQAVYEDKKYKSYIADLDRKFLEESMTYAREAYRTHLDDFKTQLEQKYNLDNPVMSPFTLGNWLVGFLYTPAKLGDLLGKHGRVPAEAMREGLPDLIEMLNDMPKARVEWQHAMALLSIPLVAGN